MSTIVRSILIGVCATILATLSLNASDNIGNLKDSLLGSAVSSLGAPECPSGMVRIDAAHGSFCVDVYEASPSKDCARDSVKTSADSLLNIDVRKCRPVSQEGGEPWVYVAQHQAQALCARAGKRLPSAHEWYFAALDTPDSKHECNISQGKTIIAGEMTGCVSAYGVYDMVGNVWEWVDMSVSDGAVDTLLLPETGYVSAVDTQGVPVSSVSKIDPLFGGDYVWSDSGVRGVLRGGFYSLHERAGVYTFHAGLEPSFTGEAIGFRCVKDL